MVHGLSLRKSWGVGMARTSGRELRPQTKNKAERRRPWRCERASCWPGVPCNPAAPPLDLGGRTSRAHHSVGSYHASKTRGVGSSTQRLESSPSHRWENRGLERRRDLLKLFEGVSDLNTKSLRDKLERGFLEEQLASYS